MPKFEVASVKSQHEPLTLENVASGAIPRALAGGRFSHTHLTVESLVTFAYDLKAYQVVGSPNWVRHDMFAIDAKAASDVPPEQIKLMVRHLLEDRFKMVAHVEPRDMHVHALAVAKANALGRNLFRMDGQCIAELVNDLRRKYPEKYLNPPGTVGGMSSCSPSGVNMLADYLTLRLGTPVIDATGLEGPFYYLLVAQLPPMNSSLGAPRSESSDLPALSTALEEQLGLKLESRKGPIDVLVIDSVSPPTEN